VRHSVEPWEKYIKNSFYFSIRFHRSQSNPLSLLYSPSALRFQPPVLHDPATWEQLADFSTSLLTGSAHVSSALSTLSTENQIRTKLMLVRSKPLYMHTTFNKFFQQEEFIFRPKRSPMQRMYEKRVTPGQAEHGQG